MKIKVGDNVRIIAGKDKGKEGKVLRTLKKDNKVVVEGLNIIKKHAKPNNSNDKGGIFDIEAPIHASNVKVIAEVKKAKAKKTEKVVEAKVEEKKASKKTTKKASKKDGE